jgi:transcriptional antiterminator NusG
VTGFVGGARNPPPVPESEVMRITQMLSDDEEVKPVLDFEIGEEVRLTEGRYASMRGTVDEINEQRGKLRVVINMFGRPVPTELSFHQVEKLS